MLDWVTLPSLPGLNTRTETFWFDGSTCVALEAAIAPWSVPDDCVADCTGDPEANAEPALTARAASEAASVVASRFMSDSSLVSLVSRAAAREKAPKSTWVGERYPGRVMTSPARERGLRRPEGRARRPVKPGRSKTSQIATAAAAPAADPPAPDAAAVPGVVCPRSAANERKENGCCDAACLPEPEAVRFCSAGVPGSVPARGAVAAATAAGEIGGVADGRATRRTLAPSRLPLHHRRTAAPEGRTPARAAAWLSASTPVSEALSAVGAGAAATPKPRARLTPRERAVVATP